MGSSVDNLPVGLFVHSLNQSWGLLGLGFPTESKPTLFSQLYDAKSTVQQGVFSIHFDKKSSDASNKGELIFGGSDKIKYTGELATSSVNPINNVYTKWYLTGQYTSTSSPIGNAASNSYNNSNDLIDTGNIVSFLPQDMVESIVGVFTETDVKFNSFTGMYDIPCGDYEGYNVTFTLGANGNCIELKVSVSETIADYGDNQYVIPIAPNTNNEFIPGLTVVSNFYMVFDTVQHGISFGSNFWLYCYCVSTIDFSFS